MLVTRHQNLITGLVRITAIAVSMLVLTVLVVTRSEAAFTDTTSNSTNLFTAGTVVLEDDDDNGFGARALFTATGLKPADPVRECIALTYSGDLVPADVRMYATSSGGLAPFLNVTVETGTNGSFGDCTTFASTGPIYTDTLANFGTDWATGAATFTATASPTTQVLRFTVEVQDVPAAQGQTAGAEFIWEAQG